MTFGRGTWVGTAALAVGVLGLAGCGSGAAGSAGSGGVQLSLVAYSTPQEAYQQIIKAYQQTPAGRHVTFRQSYGASGDQSRAVAAGLRADVVAFSLAPDVTRLVKANLVKSTWDADRYHGMVTDSVAVIGTRKGNPKGIRSWDDLVKPGVEVITPNPFTSGGARWNVMAAYGAESNVGKDAAAGRAYLGRLFSQVPVQDDSGRKSLQTFTGGKGDAFISYENEAIFAQKHDQPVDYTVPDKTILIENPVAVTANSAHPKEAADFVAFLRSATAQKIFAANGYRPVVAGVPGADAFPKPSGLFTIADLGGWTTVTKTFFDPQSDSVMLQVEKKLGVSVAKK
jgi:sulfate/thiosulfate transport system substrate-binding protein